MHPRFMTVYGQRTSGQLLGSPALCLWAVLGFGLSATELAKADASLEPGWQVGIGASVGDYQLTGTGLDDNGVGFKAWGQYRFNPYFGIEGSVLDTGTFDESVTASDQDGNASLTARGFSLDALGYLPYSVADIQFFGKVGFFSLNQTLSIDEQNANSRRADGLTLGLGMNIPVAEDLALRVESDWYDLDGAHFWSAGLGVSYHFD